MEVLKNHIGENTITINYTTGWLHSVSLLWDSIFLSVLWDSVSEKILKIIPEHGTIDRPDLIVFLKEFFNKNS